MVLFVSNLRNTEGNIFFFQALLSSNTKKRGYSFEIASPYNLLWGSLKISQTRLGKIFNTGVYQL